MQHSRMSFPNRHHYLPVFYLKKWAAEDGRVVRYHRPYDRTVTSRLKPTHTGYEDGLYTLDGEPDDFRQTIEQDFFSHIDSDTAPILDTLIAQGPATLQERQRSIWTRFIMSLQLRGPHSLNEIKAFMDRTIREVIESTDGEKYRSTRKEDDPDSAYDYARQQSPDEMMNAHKMLLPRLIDHQAVGQLIINMHWSVMDLSQAADMLLTADRPFTSSHGLGNPACLIAVPLSPHHVFVAANSTAQLFKLAMQDAGDTVRNMNRLVVRLAVQNVYGQTENHLPTVEDTLRRANDPIVPGIITYE